MELIETLWVWLWDAAIRSVASPAFGPMVTASAVFIALAILLLPVVVERLPEDAFLEDRPRPVRVGFRGWIAPVLRNVLGGLLILAGIPMLIGPGQGLLSIFIGLLLADVPGKRWVLGPVFRRHAFQRAMNWVRKRRGRGAFIFDEAPAFVAPEPVGGEAGDAGVGAVESPTVKEADDA